MLRDSFLLALGALVIGAAALAAKEQSSVAYYPVTGSTAQTVYQSIQKQSPKIAPNATFAFTMIGTKTAQKARQAKDACRYTSFATSAVYVFYVPRHDNPKSLPANTRKRFDAFVQYLIRHEEGHRSMWRECFKEYDSEALQLAARDCKGLDKEREALFTRIKRKCLAKDEAYDFTFRKEVRKEPFVAEAMKALRLK